MEGASYLYFLFNKDTQACISAQSPVFKPLKARGPPLSVPSEVNAPNSMTQIHFVVLSGSRSSHLGPIDHT